MTFQFCAVFVGGEELTISVTGNERCTREQLGCNGVFIRFIDVLRHVEFSSLRMVKDNGEVGIVVYSCLRKYNEVLKLQRSGSGSEGKNARRYTRTLGSDVETRL